MSDAAPPEVAVRPATTADRLDVRRVLDAAVLEVEALADRLADGHVLVAVDGRPVVDGADEDAEVVGTDVSIADVGPSADGVDASDAGASGTVVGALVVAPDGPPATGGDSPARWDGDVHVRAVAVRRRRRGTGIGSALVEAAVERFGPLVADFDADVRAFYESLDASIVRGDDGRCWARVDDAR